MIFDTRYTPILGPQGCQRVPGDLLSNAPLGIPVNANAAFITPIDLSSQLKWGMNGEPATPNPIELSAGMPMMLYNRAQIEGFFNNGTEYIVQFLTGKVGT